MCVCVVGGWEEMKIMSVEKEGRPQCNRRKQQATLSLTHRRRNDRWSSFVSARIVSNDPIAPRRSPRPTSNIFFFVSSPSSVHASQRGSYSSCCRMHGPNRSGTGSRRRRRRGTQGSPPGTGSPRQGTHRPHPAAPAASSHPHRYRTAGASQGPIASPSLH